ncbi:MAG: hypothetical protein ACOY4O_11380 [Pseudomonadota bacterium]
MALIEEEFGDGIMGEATSSSCSSGWRTPEPLSESDRVKITMQKNGSEV